MWCIIHQDIGPLKAAGHSYDGKTATATNTKETRDVEDKSEQASYKRRLEAQLQLETNARRTIEENFRRVKGLGLFRDFNVAKNTISGQVR